MVKIYENHICAVKSSGNGLFVEIDCYDKNLFMQGDDASIFLDSLYLAGDNWFAAVEAYL